MAAPFRLLDLPQEIIDKVFDTHFQETNVEIVFTGGTKYRNDRGKTARTRITRKVQGVPDLAIHAVSRKVLHDSRAAFCRATDNIILVNVSKISEGVRKKVFWKLSNYTKFAWVRKFTENMVIQYEEDNWPESKVDWRSFIHAFSNLRQVRVTTVSGGHLPWPKVIVMVEKLLNDEFPVAALADCIFEDSDMMDEIAKALEEKLGPGCYEASCFVRHVTLAEAPTTHPHLPGYFSAHLSARFVKIPGRIVVCDMEDTFRERYAEREKVLAEAEAEDTDLDATSDDSSDYDCGSES